MATIFENAANIRAAAQERLYTDATDAAREAEPSEQVSRNQHQPVFWAEWLLIGLPALFLSGAGYLAGFLFPVAPVIVNGGLVGAIGFWWILKESRKMGNQPIRLLREAGWMGLGAVSPLIFIGRLMVIDQARARLGRAGGLIK